MRAEAIRSLISTSPSLISVPTIDTASFLDTFGRLRLGFADVGENTRLRGCASSPESERLFVRSVREL